MKKYASKISLGLLLFIVTVIIGSSLPLLYETIWPGLAINALTLLFVAYLYANTYYIIDQDHLVVTSGILLHKKIDIHAITQVKATRTIISAPALSFDRLEVSWGKSNSVVISPREKSKFVEHLLQINPGIATQL